MNDGLELRTIDPDTDCGFSDGDLVTAKRMFLRGWTRFLKRHPEAQLATERAQMRAICAGSVKGAMHRAQRKFRERLKRD
jgi:hypothetical protein